MLLYVTIDGNMDKTAECCSQDDVDADLIGDHLMSRVTPH